MRVFNYSPGTIRSDHRMTLGYNVDMLPIPNVDGLSLMRKYY